MQIFTIAYQSEGARDAIYCSRLEKDALSNSSSAKECTQIGPTEKSLASIITVIWLHLMSNVDLLNFIKDTYITGGKTDDASFAFTTQ